jgi:hypothetical protein
MTGVTIEKPKTPDDLLPIHLKKSDVPIEALPSFEDATGTPKRALVDADRHVQVDILSSVLPPGAATEDTLRTRASEASLVSTLPRNIAQWGGTTLTGRDITEDLAKLQNLDFPMSLMLNTLRLAKAVGLMLDVSSIPAGGSVTSSVLDIGYKAILAITVRATYNASATKGIRCDIYTSPDNVNWDTDVYASFEPSFAAGATVQKTVLIDPTARYLKVVVVNLDTSYATGAVKIWRTLGM